MPCLTEEQKMIQQMVRKLTFDKIIPRAGEMDEKDEFPGDMVQCLAENSLLKLSLPEKYGGIDANTATLSVVITELSYGSAPIGTLMLATQSVIRVINQYGTEVQKDRMFSVLSSGDKLNAFCLTEPNAGSDARALQTKAVLKGRNYTVNGRKCFITLSGVSEYYLVAVRTAARKPKDISLLIVPKNTPGLSFGKKDNKMAMRGTVTADLLFEDAVVPEGNRIGEEGEGWDILTGFSNSMRCWGAASIGLGVAQAAFEYAVKYSKERIQFGKPIAEFQAIQFMLADMEMHIEATRSLIQRTNLLVDRESEKVSNATMAMVSMAKCFATDVAMKVTTDAVQILGGYGVMKDYPVQRMMRDAKAGQIYDGSNQIQRIVIGRSLLERY